MREIEKKRLVWIDYARVFAVLCVVLCHAVETYYRPVLLGRAETDFFQWFFLTLLFLAGRLGVPVFLAITGVLMLGREWKPAAFYKKYLIPMFVLTEGWTVFNFLFKCVVQGQEFQLTTLLKEMLFLKEPGLSHMWYMPMILGMYLILPFLSRVLLSFPDGRDFIFPGALALFSFVFLPTVAVFRTEAFPAAGLVQKVEVGFLGGIYGLYLVLGYFIGKKRILRKIPDVGIILAGAVALGLNLIGQYYLYSHGYFKTTKLTWYTSAGIFAGGLCIFEMIRRYCRELYPVSGRILRWIAGCSFGIYLLHKPVQILLVKYLPIGELPLIVQAGILFFTSFFLCVCILFPVSRWAKKAGKWIFLIK